ncbi:MAG: hypothetical protein AB1457_03855 [Chloroflexota bacterium]
MMKKKTFTLNVEQVLYGLVLVVGLLLRFMQLDRLPFNDEEARLALQAYWLARGENSPFMNPDGGYLITTAALFFVFSATEFLGRFVPAFVGSLVCLMPLAFRKWLGGKAALIAALGLALDGVWLAASRQAGSQTWAVLFFLATIWAISSRHWRMAGIFGGLLLFGGMEAWKGLIPFGVAIWVYHRWVNRGAFEGNEVCHSIKTYWREWLIWAGGTLLVFGSLFLILPVGWSAVGGGLVSYLRGWINPTGVSAGLILAAMLVYQPISTLFGLSALRRQIKKSVNLEIFLTIWSFFALLHSILYPAREVLDLVWVSLPLFGLAARFLSSRLKFDFEQRTEALVYGAVVLVFLLFISQNIMRLLSPGRVAVNLQTELIAVLAAMLFVIISIILIGWGWSAHVSGCGAKWLSLLWGGLTLLIYLWLSGSLYAAGIGENPETSPLRGIIREADLLFVIIFIILIVWGWSTRVSGYGALWGGLTLLILFWLSGSFHAAGISGNPETNPFRRGWFISEADLIKDTIGDLAELNVRSRTGLDVVAIGLDQPAMRWLARDYPKFSFENTFQPQHQSSVVLTGSSEGVVFGENYRGQDFHWQVQPIWNLMTIEEWARWAIFKVAPLENKMVFLWARESLFPGSEISNEVQP